MDISNYSTIFKVVIIAIVYIIIFTVLSIIYKDIKSGGRKKTSHKSFGLEVLEPGENSNLKKGGVIPVMGALSIGRKEDNRLILSNPYVSGHHARIYLKNGEYTLEDLGSTNGVIINNKKLENKCILKPGDEIKIGSSVFKVIG